MSYCQSCNGSGEGLTDGTICKLCKGLGEYEDNEQDADAIARRKGYDDADDYCRSMG